MKSKSPLQLLLRVLNAAMGRECPMCGAHGKNVVVDEDTGQVTCLLCMMDMAVLRMEASGVNQENAAEIRERLRRIRAGEELPPWDVKVSKPHDPEVLFSPPSNGTTADWNEETTWLNRKADCDICVRRIHGVCTPPKVRPGWCSDYVTPDEE
jgi:hypothetical protein